MISAAMISGSKRKTRIASAENVNSLRASAGGHHSHSFKWRDQDARRARGEIACAECVRMKSRCSRDVPCSSCVRRGCSNICPNGVLSGGVGTRLVLANTEDLHSRLRSLCERIRQLEDALEIIQASISNDPHPLLREELLDIKRGIDVPDTAAADPPADSDLSDAFGTLTISDRGISRFIGPTGGTESLIMASPNMPEEQDDSEFQEYQADPTSKMPGSPFPSDVFDNFPTFNILGIGTKLPSWDRASSLCEIYLEHVSWLGRPIQRVQLIDELLIPIYRWKHAIDAAPPFDKVIIAQTIKIDELALLTMVFALGALSDLALPPHNEEAALYHQLTRSIMGLGSLVQNPTLANVQTMCLVSIYHRQSKESISSEMNWGLIRLASVMCSNIGLHRDPAKWKLEDKVIQRRREIFWQIFIVENMQSLSSGRPPINVLRYVDCEFPEYDYEQPNEEFRFWEWRFRFAKEVLSPLNELTFTIGPIKYSDILALDRKIHEFDMPQEIRIPSEGPNLEKDGLVFLTQRIDTIALLHLHRSFFCKALLEYPNNPFKTQYSLSCLSTYRSALSVLKVAEELVRLCPNLLSRTWFPWKHTFSCLVVLGSFATIGPHFPLTSSALVALTRGIELFEKSAPYTEKLKKALVILRNLQSNAYCAHTRHRSGQPPPGTNEIPARWLEESSWVNELSIFGGLTRFLATKEALKLDPQTVSSRTLPLSTFSQLSDMDMDIAIQMSSSTAADPSSYINAAPYIGNYSAIPSVCAEDLVPTINWAADSWGSAYPTAQEKGQPSDPRPLSVFYDGTNAHMLNDPSFTLLHTSPILPSSGPSDSMPGCFAHLDSAFGLSGDQSGVDQEWTALMKEIYFSNPYIPSGQS